MYLSSKWLGSRCRPRWRSPPTCWWLQSQEYPKGILRRPRQWTSQGQMCRSRAHEAPNRSVGQLPSLSISNTRRRGQWWMERNSWEQCSMRSSMWGQWGRTAASSSLLYAWSLSRAEPYKNRENEINRFLTWNCRKATEMRIRYSRITDWLLPFINLRSSNF